jgi:hypothetical protein
MITIGEWLNPTRAVGLLAYGTATICCGIAWVRAKNQGQDWHLPALLTLIESVLLLDIAVNGRWMLHAFVGDFARHRHEYELRKEPQVIALEILAALLLWGLFAAQRVLRGKAGDRLAVSGILLSVVVWCVEVVSLHDVDHILYHHVGKWMVVSALWILACLMTSFGMLFVSGHAKPFTLSTEIESGGS